jgi:hypothetical protein
VPDDKEEEEGEEKEAMITRNYGTTASPLSRVESSVSNLLECTGVLISP